MRKKRSNKKIKNSNKYTDPYELKGEENTSYLKEIAGLTALIGGATVGGAFMPNATTRVAAASIDPKSQVVGSVEPASQSNNTVSNQPTDSKSNQNNLSASTSRKISLSTSKSIADSASLSLSQSESLSASLSTSLSQSMNHSESIANSSENSHEKNNNEAVSKKSVASTTSHSNSQVVENNNDAQQNSNNSDSISLSNSNSTLHQQVPATSAANSQNLQTNLTNIAGLTLLNINGANVTADKSTNSLGNKFQANAVLANTNVKAVTTSDENLSGAYSSVHYWENKNPQPQNQYFQVNVYSGELHNLKKGETFTINIGKNQSDILYDGGPLETNKYFDTVNEGNGTYKFIATDNWSTANFGLTASIKYNKAIDQETAIPLDITMSDGTQTVSLPQDVNLEPAPKPTSEETHPDIKYICFGVDKQDPTRLDWGVYVNFNQQAVSTLDINGTFSGNQKLLKDTIMVQVPTQQQVEEGTSNSDFTGAGYDYDLSKKIQDQSTDSTFVLQTDDYGKLVSQNDKPNNYPAGYDYSSTPIYIYFQTQVVTKDGQNVPSGTQIYPNDHTSDLNANIAGKKINGITPDYPSPGNSLIADGNLSLSISSSQSASASLSESESKSKSESISNSQSVSDSIHRSESVSTSTSTSLSESISSSTSLSESISSSTSLSESISSSTSLSESISSSISLSESISSSTSLSESISSSTSLSESISSSTSLSESISSSTSLSESISSSTSLSESISSSTSLSESISSSTSLSESISSSTSLSESISSSTSLSESISSSTSLSESISSSTSLSESISSSTSLSESISSSTSLSESISSSTSLSESISSSTSLRRLPHP